MNKKMLMFFLVLISFGVGSILQAQTTHKKHHKKKKEAAVNTDSIAAAAKADSMARVAAAASTTPQGVLDTSMQTPGLVADTGVPSYNWADLDSTKPVDGLYKIPILRGAKPFALPKENAYDIKFYKRIWRTIDLHDSLNKVFATPGETLVSLIISSIKAGKLIAYKDEKFQHAMTYTQVMRSLTDSVIVPIIDSTGQELGSKTEFNDFNPDSVTKFEMKEDVYFDKVRGRIITSIVGLAPIKAVKTSQGDYVGDTHPFWLYFPQCRVPFAGKDIFDTQRDIYNISFDDIFMQRNFRTLIVKESNPADLRIKDIYPDEVKQQQESDRIEREIRNYKVNTWKY